MKQETIEDRREIAESIAQAVDREHLAPDLHTGHSTIQQKITAAVAYKMEGGNAKEAARIAGVHHNSLYNWKKEDWWQDLQDYISREFDEDFKHRLGQIAITTMDQLEDRVVNGDTIMNYKTGELVHKPMDGKALATTLGIIFDKKQIASNKPNSISSSSSESERLKKLEQYFEELAEKKINNSIEGQYREITNGE